MSVAVLETWHALTVVCGIADIQWQAPLALWSHRIIVALQTNVELVRAGAITMAVALALDRTIGADVTEVAAAHVGLDARASHAALRTHGHAYVPANNYEYLKRLRDAHFTMIESLSRINNMIYIYACLENLPSEFVHPGAVNKKGLYK